MYCNFSALLNWGLRKYKGEQQRVWGGDADCEHEWKYDNLIRRSNDGGQSAKQLTNVGANRRDEPIPYAFCQLCGAWYGALGLEPTPELHIEHMVEIFREIRRVLRDDGVVYLNYGDCYSAAGWECNRQSIIGSGSMSPEDRKSGKSPGFAAGNLMMMPHKVAIALQADGWVVRNDVVWWKRNPMPESVAGWRWERNRKLIGEDPRGNEGDARNATLGKSPQRDHDGREFAKPEYEYGDDYVLRKGSWRHTRAHEYIFQLVKSMGYYSNQEAVREEFQTDISENYPHRSHILGRGGLESLEQYPGSGPQRRSSGGYPPAGAGRNPRSVLDVPTAPYKGAHYATFPPNLIAPLIRASCPKRCCPECGAPWAPVVEVSYGKSPIHGGQIGKEGTPHGMTGMPRVQRESNVIDYRPTCSCERDDHIPGICLDPFIGSGTTGAVARELGRRWVGLDISMEYLDQQAKIRALKWTPSDALVGLPLFEGLNDEKSCSA